MVDDQFSIIDDAQDAREAAELCGRCPAREPCEAWVDELAHSQAHGVIAGQHRVWVSHPSVAKRAALQLAREPDG